MAAGAGKTSRFYRGFVIDSWQGFHWEAKASKFGKRYKIYFTKITKKPAFDRFFQEAVPKSTGLWNSLNILKNQAGYFSGIHKYLILIYSL
jgi:hypothetical protein